MHKKQLRYSRKRQAGWLMLEVSLALLVVAGYTALKLSEDYDDAVNLHLRARAKGLDTVKSAAAQYAARYYGEIVSGQNSGSITASGAAMTVQVASPGGNASYTVGDANHPTIKDLIALHLLTQSFSDRAIGGGAYGIALETSPAGCADNECNIEGLAFIDKPYQASGKESYALAGRSVQFLGADGMTSLPRTPQIMSGYAGKFSLPNPVTPAVAGLIGTRFDFRGPVRGTTARVQPKQADTPHDTVTAAAFLTPLRSVGDSCNQDGAIASGTSGILFCIHGRFEEVSPLATQGDVCGTSGTTAKDKATLESLVCKNGRFVRLSNVLARSVPQSTVRVTDGLKLVKPVCEAGGTAAFTGVATNDPASRSRLTATASGSTWTIHLSASAGTDRTEKVDADVSSELVELTCNY